MEKIKIEVKDNQEQVDVCIVKYSTQTSVGIQSVIGGTDIEVDNNDPLNPIVNFDGDFIPLSGTEVGSPVTGDITNNDGNNDIVTIRTGDGDEPGGVIIRDNANGILGEQLRVYQNGVFKDRLTNTLSLQFDPQGIRISDDDNISSKGFFGATYYGANYDDNTYVQKKYVDDNFAKIAPNKRLVNATTSGTFNLNHSLYSDWKLTLTGATTLTDSNLPTGDYTIEFTMKITGSFGLTLPSYWSVNGDTYDGTKWNFFAVQVHKGDVGSEEVTVFITNLA